jgi:hypothetical protein
MKSGKISDQNARVSYSWEVTFDDLEPAQLSGRIWFIGFVRVVGQEPFLDVIFNGASRSAAVDAFLMC